MPQSIRSTFNKDLKDHFRGEDFESRILTREKTDHLPVPVRRYLEYCGFTGKEIPQNAELVWDNSFIKMKPRSKWLRLKTLQFNSADPPFRIAYMKARMAGIIPFEGRDLYINGKGHTLGKIAGVFTVFNEKDMEIAQGGLVVLLAESLMIPGMALSNLIKWKEINSYKAKAEIVNNGIKAEGIFFFNEKGEMTSFEADRYYSDPEKGFRYMPFIAKTEDYRLTKDNLRLPHSISACWNLENGEYNYWKGQLKEIRYNIRPEKKHYY